MTEVPRERRHGVILWTIYEGDDGNIVVQAWHEDRNGCGYFGEPITGCSLELLRENFTRAGFECIPAADTERRHGVVETWF